MRKVNGDANARWLRPALGVALVALVATDVAVAIVSPSRTTPQSRPVAVGSLATLLSPAGAARQAHHAGRAKPAAMTASSASVVPHTAGSPQHKKRKPDSTPAGAVLGVVNALTSPSQPAPPSTGGRHHPKSGSPHHNGGSPPSATSKGAVGRRAPQQDLQFVPSETVLATLKHNAPGFSTAHSTRRAMTVPKSWYGRTTSMPVVAQTATRLKVRLARRPDESTIWIRRSAATLSHTYYALLVDISKRRLYLFRAGQQIGSYPVGVGLRQTPTPTGSYFIAFHAPPNGPGYGSVMLETSAHSKVFQTFEGGNDAIIAIHGPIDSTADREIGKNGARVSNGCIRMHDGQLVKVGRVPDGTPIELHS